MAKETTPAGESTEKKKARMNRREFLNFAWLASLGFLTLNVAGVTYLFAMPRFKEGEFGGIFTYGTVGDLPTSDQAPTNIPSVKMWMSNTDAGVTAIYKVCTHLGCLYNWSDQSVRFVCPCHGSQFDKDGAFLAGPAPRSLDRFVVQYVDQTDNVVAQTNPAGDPLPVPDDPSLIVKVDTGKRIPGKPK
jgi:cytochrome b6-f complex iron-sulfur subunit